jgi:hypothetical protein
MSRLEQFHCPRLFLGVGQVRLFLTENPRMLLLLRSNVE